jgi:hypothetical protein
MEQTYLAVKNLQCGIPDCLQRAADSPEEARNSAILIRPYFPLAGQ